DWKLPPDRIVRNELMAAKRVGEDALAEAARFSFAHRREAGARERVGTDLDDEGAAVGRVAIVMRVERAERAVDEGLRQRVERLRRAEPGEAVGEQPRTGAERAGVC